MISQCGRCSSQTSAVTCKAVLQIADPQDYSLPSNMSGVKRLLFVLSGTRIPDASLKASKQLEHKCRRLSAWERIKNAERRNARFACQHYASNYEAMNQTGRDYVEMFL
jgi:hypothetical protein